MARVRKTHFILLMLALLAFSATIPGGRGGGGPIAYWSFDEGSGSVANDQSVNNYDGTIYGATWTTGISGSALDFDGSNDYVRTANVFNSAPEGLTVMAWAKPIGNFGDGIDSDIVIVSETKSGGGCPNEAFVLWTGAGGDLTRFQVTSSSSSVWGVAISSAPPESDTWYHFVGTYDGSSVKLYIDGELESSSSYTGELCFVDTSIEIGKKFNGNYWNGLIDEVKIYNYSLSASEIETEYYANVQVILPECVNDCSSSGQKTCSGNGYKTCGNYDADECLEWSDVTSCASGENCVGGTCTAESFCGDGTCDSGESCSNCPADCGTCPAIPVDPSDDDDEGGVGGGKANGQSCSSANECTGGYCVHSKCASAGYVLNDGYCDSGETCVNSASDCACQGGLICDSTTKNCVSCTEDSCTTGYCYNNQQCVQCLSDSHCKAGEACNPSTHTCSGCVTDADCFVGARWTNTFQCSADRLKVLEKGYEQRGKCVESSCSFTDGSLTTRVKADCTGLNTFCDENAVSSGVCGCSSGFVPCEPKGRCVQEGATSSGGECGCDVECNSGYCDIGSGICLSILDVKLSSTELNLKPGEVTTVSLSVSNNLHNDISGLSATLNIGSGAEIVEIISGHDCSNNQCKIAGSIAGRGREAVQVRIMSYSEATIPLSATVSYNYEGKERSMEKHSSVRFETTAPVEPEKRKISKSTYLWIGLGVLAFLIFRAGRGSKAQKEVKKPVKQPESKAPESKPSSDLKEYISKAIEKGQSFDEIKKKLLEIGWEEDEIIESYCKLTGLPEPKKK